MGRLGTPDLPDGATGIFFVEGLDRYLLICPSGWPAAGVDAS